MSDALAPSEIIHRLYALRRRVAATKARWIAPHDAAESLRLARAEYARDPANAEKRVRYESPTPHGLLPIWSDLLSNGAPPAVGGERGRWIEEPTLARLREVGTPESIGVTKVTGYYLNPCGDGETVSGVVYQLPARKGRARFLAGYADPFGNGGAFLSLEIFESDDWRTERAAKIKRNPKTPSYNLPSSESAADDAKREAAHRADGMAESMAKDEREYQEAYQAGANAREKAREARAAGKAWLALMREARNAFATRRARGMVGIPLAETLAVFRDLKARIREACEKYQDARDAAREARDDIGAWAWRKYGAAIREGYDNAG